MKIYIAHPYTGDEERNHEHALQVEETLRKATLNAEFINPVGRMTEQLKGLSYIEAMDRCLAELASCDGIVICKGWKNSTGCRIEVKMARQMQMPRWYGVDAYMCNWTQVASKEAALKAMA